MVQRPAKNTPSQPKTFPDRGRKSAKEKALTALPSSRTPRAESIRGRFLASSIWHARFSAVSVAAGDCRVPDSSKRNRHNKATNGSGYNTSRAAARTGSGASPRRTIRPRTSRSEGLSTFRSFSVASAAKRLSRRVLTTLPEFIPRFGVGKPFVSFAVHCFWLQIFFVDFNRRGFGHRRLSRDFHVFI